MPNHKTIAHHVAVAEPTPPAVAESVHYPDSDGHFLPEHPLQARAILNVRFALQLHFEPFAKFQLACHKRVQNVRLMP